MLKAPKIRDFDEKKKEKSELLSFFVVSDFHFIEIGQMVQWLQDLSL
jgi:hypothetical protein